MSRVQVLLRTLLLLLTIPQWLNAADNSDVLAAARSYQDGGGYNKDFSGSGTPEEIVFMGKRILSKGDKTYCNGLTFAVVMKVAAARGLLKESKIADIQKFQQNWYGANGESKEKQCQYAMETLGIGTAVSADQAEPGDFVQFWRTNSGHSAVFLSWVTEDGKRVGIRYRSSQGKTDGVGDNTEYFKSAAGKNGSVDPNRIYLARLAKQK